MEIRPGAVQNESFKDVNACTPKHENIQDYLLVSGIFLIILFQIAMNNNRYGYCRYH